jgi:superfamily II DNA helicase RecQ
MAPSLRRPRPFSEDADGSRSRHCIIENLDTSDNNNNNNSEVLEQKLLTLSALEAQREEKRRRMEEVFQQITSLQMEMKDLEAELGIMDHDIEEMEDEIQKSAAVNAASTATTTSAMSRTTTKSAPPPPGTATAATAAAAAAAATTTTTQTQMDEILTDPTAAMLTSQSPLPPSASAMLSTSIIPSQEQLTEPTDHSPPAATLAAASLRQQPALHQKNPPFSVSSGSSSGSSGSSSSSANRPMALVGQLQFTTTATTTTNTAAAAVVTLSRKKPPPAAASSSISSLSSSLPSAASAAASAASAAPAPQHQQQQQQPQQQTLFTTCRQQPPHQQQRQQSSSAAAAAEAAVSSPYSHDQFPWSQKVYDLLHNTFRIPSFRDYQKEIINATLSGQDAFVLMRTGGGKSLTYQLPALLEGRCSSSSSSKKVTLCISPLLSLIQDQEAQMNAFSPGSALSFTSGLPGGTTEQARRWNLVRDASAGVCLILVTPEKVHKSNKLRNELQKLHDAHRLGRFVIDEAHCASQWGSDFRPDYAQLGILKRHFPTVPLLAVTATASPRVRNDVCRILGLCSPSSTTTSSSSSAHGGGGGGSGATTTTTVGRPYCFFRSTAHRPNLSYSVRTKIDGKDAVIVDMVAFIKDKYSARNGSKNAAAGIVYTLSRKDADQVAAKLCDYGVVARAYHSDVSPTQKQAIHASWMKNQTQVVVATIAFGYVSIAKIYCSYYKAPSRRKQLRGNQRVESIEDRA